MTTTQTSETVTRTERIAALKEIDEADLVADDLGLGEWIQRTSIGEDTYGNEITAYEMTLIKRTTIIGNEDGERKRVVDYFSPDYRYRFVRFGHEYHKGGTIKEAQ